MKMFISVNENGSIAQVVVEVQKIISHLDMRFALHLLPESDIWAVSELETGIQVCKGEEKDETIKKAEEIIEKHYDMFLQKKKTFFQKAFVFTD